MAVVVILEVVLVVVTAVTVVLVVTVVVVLELVLVVARPVLVVVAAVVIRVLVRAGAVIDTFVEVLIFGIRFDVLIIVSDVAVGLFIGALTGIIIGVLTNIAVDVLADVNINLFAGVMTAFDFAMLETFRCWAAFDGWPMAVLGCVSVLHAWMPSYHV